MCSHTQCEHEEANPWIDSCFSGGSGEEGVWKVLVFFSTLPQLFFSLLDAVVTGPRTMGAESIPKQETATVYF